MKKLKVIGCIVLLFVIFGIFIDRNQGQYEIYVKNAFDETTGNTMVSDGTKIYYYSQVNEDKGIFSIDQEGENVEFIVTCDKIGKMQIVDHNLYFTEYVGNYLKDKKMIPQYRLRRYDILNGEKENLDIYPQDLRFKDEQSVFRNVVDFYMFDATHILVRNTDYTIPSRAVSYGCFIIDIENKKIIKNSELQVIPLIIDNKEYYLYCYGNIRILAENNINSDEVCYINERAEGAYFDINSTERMQFTKENLYKKRWNYLTQAYKDGMIFLSNKDSLVVLKDSEPYEVIGKYALSQAGYIKWVKPEKDSFWVGVLEKSFFHIGSKETLYYIKEQISENIAVCDGEIVYFDGERLITADRNIISSYIISGDNALERVWSKKYHVPVHLSKIKIESNGTWIFISEEEVQSNKQNVIYKIRVVDGTQV